MICTGVEVFDKLSQTQPQLVGSKANHTTPTFKTFFIKILGVDDRAVDIRKHLEFWGAANIVTIAAGAVADDLVALPFAHLARLKRLDHPGRLGHAANPFVTFDCHGGETPNLRRL